MKKVIFALAAAVTLVGSVASAGAVKVHNKGFLHSEVIQWFDGGGSNGFGLASGANHFFNQDGGQIQIKPWSWNNANVTLDAPKEGETLEVDVKGLAVGAEVNFAYFETATGNYISGGVSSN